MQQHLHITNVISPIVMELALQQSHEGYLKALYSSINLRHRDLFEVLSLYKQIVESHAFVQKHASNSGVIIPCGIHFMYP
jgi:hypothetical protein